MSFPKTFFFEAVSLHSLKDREPKILSKYKTKDSAIRLLGSRVASLNEKRNSPRLDCQRVKTKNSILRDQEGWTSNMR